MHFISHRGNLNGPDLQNENNPIYVQNAVNLGFEVEIDIYFKNNLLWLGHDKPDYQITDINWLKNKKFWCHAKNIEAFHFMLGYPEIHCFWHQNDDCTLTTLGYVWTYPGKLILDKSIMVSNKYINKSDIPVCSGICSDYINKIKYD